MSTAKYSLLDHLIIAVDNGVRSLCSKSVAHRQSPAQEGVESCLLTADEKSQSAALMRVNHAGEVCAQALYYGQALVAKSSLTRQTLLKSAEEETDHLAWCAERIDGLGSYTSYLNPLWYIGAFSMGVVAGMSGDRWSLGFVVETERQVGRHLARHLAKLPTGDVKSRLILEQMCQEEARHATVAMGAGAMELPELVKIIMHGASKLMTTIAYYI